MNGSWITIFDAPTRRMIPVSRRRLKAESRMVVAISRMAQTIITPATLTATRDAAFMTEKSRSRSWRWSITVSTPACEEKVSLMIWYFSGSFMLIRKEAGSWSGVTESTIGELENCSLKCL